MKMSKTALFILGGWSAGALAAVIAFAQTTYQPIPNYQGIGAGNSLLGAINNRFSGAQPISPLATELGAVKYPLACTGSGIAVPDGYGVIDVAVNAECGLVLPACAQRHVIRLNLMQDGTGHAITFTAASGWSFRPSGGPPSIPTTASSLSVIAMDCAPDYEWYALLGWVLGE